MGKIIKKTGFTLAIFLMAACVVAATPRAAKAADQGSAQAVPISELETLAQTLENDGERKKFIATLKGLIATQKTGSAKPNIAKDLSGRVAGAISGHLLALGNRVVGVVGVLEDVPDLIPWAKRWATDESKRNRLFGVVWHFLVIVAAGMAGQYVFRFLTGHWRKGVETDTGTEIAGRVWRFVLRTVLLFANAVAYGAGAYGALVLLPMTGVAHQVLFVGASSFFVAKMILAATRTAVSPGLALLRPIPISDETANYLYIWARRLVRIFVYAFFLLEAVRLVGLPAPAYESLLYLLGFVLAGFVVVFVLQNRMAAATAIRGDAEGAYGGLRARIAATWHLFAIGYVMAVYLVWLFKVAGGFEFLISATLWTAILVVGAKLAILGTERATTHLFAISDDLDSRFPGLKTRANRYVPVLNKIIAWVVSIGAGLIVLDVWGVDTLGWLASEEGTVVIGKSVTVAIILLMAFVAWEGLNLAIGRYLDGIDDNIKGAARARTLLPLMRTTAAIVILLLTVLVVLSEIGVNIGPLLAGAGVFGLAIGFGSQKLVQDVITGLFILIEDTLAIGDVVRFDSDHAGTVEALSIRSVCLRDLAGNVHTLPFSEVKTILNMTKDWSYYALDVGVGYRENVDHVITVLKEIGDDLKADPEFGVHMLESIDVLGLDQFGDSAVIIKARIKTKPLQQWIVGREFNRRMKERFDAENIEIPFPHQTIYFGEDRDGNAPPANVAMKPTPPESS
ncbi:MAG: mechanosensitive ion channel [Rhodospirillales bacterium]|nr:mechanosensitive ion channel [Rhodospirillales bacterium]MBT4006937.1 mechanosensitive ion channel [Rhodospirillales bacterium]MBT5075183.1 mechanosensitive ion channel [Rhodospirillales bacterium]MBT5113036.1 mechanosensitive ion channel [Rhodospirillales bacterium]MBT5672912.1 mechanosensitive ion channel [Rhodospirillales bacterium]